MTASEAIHILIADDHLVFRMGLRTLIQSEPSLTVIAEARNGDECVALYKKHRPQVLLIDLRMPHGSGLETIQRIRAEDNEARVLVLSSYGTEEEIFQAIQLGAMGYLLKDVSRDELTNAIRAVARGEKWIPPAIAASLAERDTRRNLTPREIDILRLLAKGLINREIAAIFGVSKSTVKNQINLLFTKLEVTDRTEAATVAIQRGIVHLDD
jgi:DNA-binding NarL/FixJ family response regulator